METKAIEETDVKATADDSGSTPELKPENTVTAAEKLCCDDPVDPNASANTDILIGNEKEELKSAKEKQCWNMYCKMTEKGINVSFDTILRGMLTPTEYRLSKKHTETVSNTASTEN